MVSYMLLMFNMHNYKPLKSLVKHLGILLSLKFRTMDLY